MEKQGVVFRTKEELGDAVGNAWSFAPLNMPKNPAYIGSLKEEDNTYHYYKDEDGNYFYKSENTLRFDREMKEAQKRRKLLKQKSQY